MSAASQPAAPPPAATGIGLPPEALARIADAVTAAEARTSAEIKVVVSAAPLVRHRFFSILWAALAALVVPWGLVVGWMLARAAGLIAAGPLSALDALAVQAVLFVALAALLMLPAIAGRVIPHPAREAAGRTMAIELFHAHGIPQTTGRTGILIFVAAHDGLVEVVADAAVDAALGREAWSSICAAILAHAADDRLADGLVEGTRLAGTLLADALPAGPDDTNELDDRVIVL